MQKKIVMLIAIIAVCLCACTNNKKINDKEESIKPNENTEIINNEIEANDGFEDEIDEGDIKTVEDYMADKFDDDITIKIASNGMVIDTNYIKEYYKIMAQYDERPDVSCLTIFESRNDFPYLVIKENDEEKGTEKISVYEYDGKNAVQRDSSIVDKVASENFVSIYEGISDFENAYIEYHDILEILQEKKNNNWKFADYMNECLDQEIFYGSGFSSVEDLDDEDNVIVTEDQSAVISFEDNKLYLTVTDSVANFEKKVEIVGIPTKVIFGTITYGSEMHAAHPEKIYQLTDKGDVYTISIDDFYSSTNGTIEAHRMDKIENVISIIALSKYPTAIQENHDNSQYYGLSFDGVLYNLD